MLRQAARRLTRGTYKTNKDMKVIKRGNTPSYRATCPYCGCEFEFLESEAVMSFHENDLYVHCPECKGIVRDVHFERND